MSDQACESYLNLLAGKQAAEVADAAEAHAAIRQKDSFSDGGYGRFDDSE